MPCRHLPAVVCYLFYDWLFCQLCDDLTTFTRYNEERYGVKTSYNEDLEQYTTKLDKTDSAEYRKKEQEAERLAAEIEQNSTSRRNIDLENGDEDEEMRHSAVIRPTAASPVNRSASPSLGNKKSVIDSHSCHAGQVYIIVTIEVYLQC